MTSPAHHSKDHGSYFPAENLTDGRTDGTGWPGDGSFGLASNGDRSVRDISVQISDDSEIFHEIAFVELQQIADMQVPDRPAEHPREGGGLNEIRIFAT